MLNYCKILSSSEFFACFQQAFNHYHQEIQIPHELIFVIVLASIKTVLKNNEFKDIKKKVFGATNDQIW